MSTKYPALSWDISPLALLALALWYFFDEDGSFALLLPGVLVHEAGHALLLRLGGLRLRRVSLGLFGLEMDYWGQLAGPLGLGAIGAGPLFGLAYGFVCCQLGGGFWELSGGLSILLSLFNLLPVLPLDGGRLLLMAAGERGVHISRGISLAMLIAAATLWIQRGWFSLFVMAAWLVWCNFRQV